MRASRADLVATTSIIEKYLGRAFPRRFYPTWAHAPLRIATRDRVAAVLPKNFGFERLGANARAS